MKQCDSNGIYMLLESIVIGLTTIMDRAPVQLMNTFNPDGTTPMKYLRLR